MNSKTLTQLRNDDFANCLRAVAARYERAGRTPAAETIIAEAIASRPQRYYINYSTIASTLLRLRKSGALTGKGKCSPAQQKWVDINLAVNRYIALHRGATLHDAITYVFHFERPQRFNISEKIARKLFRQTLRREYRYVC